MNTYNEEKILQLLTQLVEDVSDLKKNVLGIKQNVLGVNKDVSSLKQDMLTLRQDVSALKQGNIIIKNCLDILEKKVNHLMSTTVKMEFDFNNKIDTLFDAFDLNRNMNYTNCNSISHLQKNRQPSVLGLVF